MNAPRALAVVVALIGVAAGAVVAQAGPLQLSGVVVAWLGVASAVVSASQAFLPPVQRASASRPVRPRARPPTPD